MLCKIAVPTIAMVVVLTVFNTFFTLDVKSVVNAIITIAANTILGGLTYVFIAYKMQLFDDIFGRAYLKKLIKKLTFGKVSLKD